ncbi:LytTR family DNA-binding domain-containing protein [uncultured Parabacteroides sp.]|uniref:LytR/AlgR family response regulator transcription factor n=1 Tax=uncultured Parabacteroides sp. TaxID=512312 RepID=UPI00261B28E8|nr:LytTR family DNA-binding domain-containing protein [uncultured Parabacteroides sp.]
MIRCIAIDDEPLALAQIVGYIGKVAFLELIKGCSSAMEALEIVNKEKTDLIFVDINMPDLNGMDFVKSLSHKPMIIFTTAYSEYAVEGFRVEALDYLLKPFGFNDFLRSANKALRQSELLSPKPGSSTEIATGENEHLYVKADYKMIRLDIDKIIYAESKSEYVRIYLENEKPIMTLLSMKILEERLPMDKFMRVHRSFLVNTSKITAIANNRIIIGKDVYIPIGNQFKEKFNNYIDKHFLGKM